MTTAVNGFIRKVEVAAARFVVGKHFTTGDTDFFGDTIPKALVKDCISFVLDGQIWIREERKILHLAGVGKIN